MKESNLKLAQKDIEDALKAVEEMENCINQGTEKNNILKEKFMTLTEKVQKLENLLKTSLVINSLLILGSRSLESIPSFLKLNFII